MSDRTTLLQIVQKTRDPSRGSSYFLAAFPWASFRRTKGAIKLHVGLDQAGHLPSFLSVTDGKAGDVTVARTWTFPSGSVVVADRAYQDFKWLYHLGAALLR